MDYSTDRSFPQQQQHVHYPPSSHHMSSRSITVNSSSDSFSKRPFSASDESILDAPSSTAREQPVEGTRRWYHSVRYPNLLLFFSLPDPFLCLSTRAALTTTLPQLFPKSVPIRLFLATVLLETVIDLAIQADIFSRLGSVHPGAQSGHDPVKRVALYLGIFAFAQCVSRPVINCHLIDPSPSSHHCC